MNQPDINSILSDLTGDLKKLSPGLESMLSNLDNLKGLLKNSDLTPEQAKEFEAKVAELNNLREKLIVTQKKYAGMG